MLRVELIQLLKARAARREMPELINRRS